MLETEIVKLTAAIKMLTAAIDASQPKQVEVSVQPIAKLPEAVSVINIGVNSLQSRCLELSRINKDNNAKIKVLIKSYGGNLINDIPESQLTDFATKLEELA